MRYHSYLNPRKVRNTSTPNFSSYPSFHFLHGYGSHSLPASCGDDVLRLSFQLGLNYNCESPPCQLLYSLNSCGYYCKQFKEVQIYIMYIKNSSILVIAGVVPTLLSQQISKDLGTGGVPIEIVHLYYDEYPQGFSSSSCSIYVRSSHARIGIAVSSTGRKFSNYARSLDPNNIAYTVAELTGNDTETPYPSAAINSPPGVRISQVQLSYRG